MKKLSQNDALTHLEYCQRFLKEDTFFGVWDECAVHYGDDSHFDARAAIDAQCRLVDLQRKGDAFVTQPGDIGYAHITRNEDHFNQALGRFIADKLIALGHEVHFDGNDWLVENKKFMGTMRINITPTLHFYGGHISLSTDNALIQKVCLKPMEKVPCGLSEYGITQEQVESWLHEFYFYWKK